MQVLVSWALHSLGIQEVLLLQEVLSRLGSSAMGWTPHVSVVLQDVLRAMGLELLLLRS
jgi:hypothetical protein